MHSDLILVVIGVLVVRPHSSDGLRCFRATNEQNGGCGHVMKAVPRTSARCCARNNAVGYAPQMTEIPGSEGRWFRCTLCTTDGITTTTEATRAATVPVWSPWSQWSQCSATCGPGSVRRTRTCTQGDCGGNNVEQMSCPNPPPCEIWSQWSHWSECSATCGEGTMRRGRTCTQGRCNGNNVEQMRCPDPLPCPIDGGWDVWSDWYPCSVTCGGGDRVRVRACDNPVPQHGGRTCQGTCFKRKNCNPDPCPVDGQWSEWGRFSECSVTCGQGHKTRRRQCNNPRPAHGGADCDGPSQHRDSCSRQNCQVDGQWSTWGQWTACSVSCGDGIKSRQRACDNPAPRDGGLDCRGNAQQQASCTMIANCPIDGGWSSWGPWGRCSASDCKPNSRGYRFRSHTCNSPQPQHGGDPCSGNTVERKVCFATEDCGVRADGTWCAWSRWSECLEGGIQVRSRQCECPTPANGGQECQLQGEGLGRDEREDDTTFCVFVEPDAEPDGPGDASGGQENDDAEDDDDDDDDDGGNASGSENAGQQEGGGANDERGSGADDADQEADEDDDDASGSGRP